MRPRVDPRERFARFVFPVTESGCWIWMGTIRSSGYGGFSLGIRDNVQAHRYSWICTCCVNPDHLFLGTAQDNSDDMCQKGRGVRGEESVKARLSADAVLAIITSTATNKALAQRYGVSACHVSMIRSGKRWAHLFARGAA